MKLSPRAFDEGTLHKGPILIRQLRRGFKLRWQSRMEDELIAHVRVFPLGQSYLAVTGEVEIEPWDLPDIRTVVPRGDLPPNVQFQLDSQRYNPKHQAISLFLRRLSLI
jgi:hypothetical protein